MTEAQWLATSDLYLLAQFLRTDHRVNRTKSGRRRMRLFGCACCRLVWPLFAPDPKCAELISEAERFADASSSRQSLARLEAALPSTGGPELGFRFFEFHAARMVANSNVFVAAVAAAQTIASGIRHRANRSGTSIPSGASIPIDGQQIAILRDIFGNPFSPVVFSPNWHTDTAVTLASQMYESRDFSAMPILADALQDAGCNDDRILDHCRGPGPHVRGCWVVDLLLSKE
ncbi:Uncharacterized protein OS=Sorangium cellulosum (strain So ce56) GN=sce5710 PE=4 SV=1 [Gemmata massiliana]|uniref:SMI1/KNR4 family protein n=1 Tax=Gemmata massiliana TaxID=1210884 RepID=A0A6P2D275_9BACT|nr:hypothetical protein [Gemmata massiliana]VTR93500.1 Uncharacterized protein OS=Sorangium cellulosum (strain So ce56) GN=sce5710 PE=4 SV=1 [Gemmata massiliana]